MENTQNFLVDFIVKTDSPDVMKMVLIEEGDWSDIDGRLRLLQQRMYECIDAAIDGHLANKFPETYGKKIVISVDFYNAPKDEVFGFFEKFSKNVFLIPSYKESLSQSDFVKNIVFEADFETILK